MSKGVEREGTREYEAAGRAGLGQLNAPLKNSGALVGVGTNGRTLLNAAPPHHHPLNEFEAKRYKS